MDKNSMCEEIRFIIYQELAKKHRITPAFIIKKRSSDMQIWTIIINNHLHYLMQILKKNQPSAFLQSLVYVVETNFVTSYALRNCIINDRFLDSMKICTIILPLYTLRN
jgi:REP element-mobilizing transposase RayT